jgi:hypothetical protein
MKLLLSLLATTFFCVAGLSQEISKSDANPEFYYLKLECETFIWTGLEFEVVQGEKSFNVPLESGKILAIPSSQISKNTPITIEFKSKKTRVKVDLSTEEVKRLKKNTVKVVIANSSYTGLRKPRSWKRFRCMRGRILTCPSF